MYEYGIIQETDIYRLTEALNAYAKRGFRLTNILMLEGRTTICYTAIIEKESADV